MLLSLPGMSLCAVSSRRPLGNTPKSLAFDQPPTASTDSQEGCGGGQSWQVNPVYCTVYTNPSAELVWMASKAKRDKEKANPVKNGGTHD